MAQPSWLAGLRGEHSVSETAVLAAHRLADDLIRHLQPLLDTHPMIHVALSGGSSAELLGAALAGRHVLTTTQWSRIHVWLVDERGVPENDPRRNDLLIRKTLFANVPLPPANLHPMPVSQHDGAHAYEHELDVALATRPTPEERSLDAVVLGMGPDGHTASLFPNSPALAEDVRLVVVNDGESVTPPRPRMTLTYPALCRARFIGLLVTGSAKYEALHQAAQNPTSYRTWPVVGVVPAEGSRLCWYLDHSVLSPSR
jgi:6-phosphogluconolactonase